MRKMLALALLGVLAVYPAAAASFTPAQMADLKRAEAYLNTLPSLKGHFLQVGPDGSSDEGTFYYRKPGRMRFEFDKTGGKNSGNFVISDGTTVAIVNPRLKTTNRYPLLDSPLSLLSSDKIDLTTDPRVVAVSEEPGTLNVTARQSTGSAQGQITLSFADTGSTLELRQWEVVDAQRLHTVVVLSDVQTGIAIDAKQFVIPDLDPFKRGNRP